MSELKHLDEVIDEHDEADPVRPKPREDDEMDITPMIDITFLLLIYFLVASTPDESSAIDLPNAQNGAPVSAVYSTVFSVGDGGLGPAPVYAARSRDESARLPDDPEQQREQIIDFVNKGLQDSKTDVIIQGDKAVKCREIQRVMKAISKVEGVKIHMAILSDR